MPEQLHLPWDEPTSRPPAQPAPGATGPRRSGDEWRLDARTRRVGLRGLARARAVLAASGRQDGRGADAA